MASQMPNSDGNNLNLRQYYDNYYRNGDFAHYSESIDKSYFHAIFMYFSIPANASVLDGGCGTAVRLGRMHRLGFNVTGIDLSGEGLHAGRKQDQESPLVQGDMLNLPFRENVFHCVISLGCSLMNAQDPNLIKGMITESLRVTQKGGWVIASTITDFSGANRGGWIHRPRKWLEQLSASIDTEQRRIVYTAPGIAGTAPRLTLHPVTSALFRLLPKYRRTVILGWQK